MLSNWGPADLSDLTTAHHRQVRQQPAEQGLVVEETATGWVGAILRVEKSGGLHVVVLEDARRNTRSFPLGHGFLVESEPVELIPAKKTNQNNSLQKQRTASGSVARTADTATVARASRIWVEGTHDAELIEKIWGDDLRELGIVVEPIGGIDHLEQKVRHFAPDTRARLVILVDHLVPGSKETRIVQKVSQHADYGQTFLVLGHPYVDVWQSIRPKTLGLSTWPTIDRSVEWKAGVLKSFGLPYQSQRDISHGWKLMLGKVQSYSDLEPSFLGRVEEMIDFLTQDDEDRYA